MCMEHIRVYLLSLMLCYHSLRLIEFDLYVRDFGKS